ncbi:BgTH12-01953 [Blumeria graminis f. sp. triticale]|uniref:Mediator of RNA polymerase II transcription subunit 6 n=3 Tax=Blumeria graminis TaxID=34373 RepID=A0A381LHU4_BLUGR|nr:Subunit of the RNA polymerase II mediator complex [Blumeria graminis f. sp. tritici 96224]CAD6501703.1 BgTH12-01953 [Blumeria graminis f. sp. triticale]VDB84340.1 Bgt-3764 [Blumeria graminis f. sp. tritici]
MVSKEPPLDEIQWKSPYAIMEMQGVHSNSVLFYFAQSPFFDRTSNNNVLFNQAMFNPNMMPVIQTREAFEGRLKTMAGLEFIVAQEPAEMAPGTGTGVWVIRKQTRRKIPRNEDEITVHSTYFVVGENIYMAPSTADIIASRMLSMMYSLNKFFSLTSELPRFSPALGHTYVPFNQKIAQPSNLSGLSQNNRENNIPSDELTPSKYQNNFTNKSETNTVLATRLLEESINTYLKYGDEYMDENPITGEPGAFHLTSTGRAEKSAAAFTTKGPLQITKPAPLKTDRSPLTNEKKAEKSPKTFGSGKQKRKKSRATANETVPA